MGHLGLLTAAQYTKAARQRQRGHGERVPRRLRIAQSAALAGLLNAFFMMSALPPRALADDAERAAALRVQGRQALDAGDATAAVAAYRDALHFTPRDADLWNDLGLAWNAAAQPDSAQASFETSIRIAPKKAEAHMNLAVLLMHRGVTGRARSEFEQAVEATPRDPLPYWNYAAALIDVGKPEQARQELQRALAIDPDCGPAHAEMGRVEILAGHNTTAVARFARAESLGVANPAMHANYGLALLRAGRPADAELQLERATREDSTRAATWNHLGVARLRQGHVQDAIEPLRHAARLEPRNDDVRFNLASVFMRLERYHDAELVLRAPRPVRADLLAAWGMALRAQGRATEALPLLREAAERAPRDPAILVNYGVLLAETGDVPAALDVWRRVLEIDPNNATARDNLAARGGTVPAPAK